MSLRVTPITHLRIEVKKIKHDGPGRGWNVLAVKTIRNGGDEIKEKLVLSQHRNREIPAEARLREANDQARAIGLIFEVHDVRLAGINDPAEVAHEGEPDHR